MNPDIRPNERLIVALDVDTSDEAIRLVERLEGCVSFFKVGLQLFVGAGFEVVEELLRRKKQVFLDLKIEDVPATIQRTVSNMAVAGVGFFTIGGNGPTAAAAKVGRGDNAYPKLLQITALSSWDDDDLYELTRSKDIGVNDWALVRADKIMGAGCDGMIASGDSVRLIRDKYPKGMAIIVTPGIRPQGASVDDHKRTLTPYKAILAGSDYLVVGRPITGSNDPRKAAEEIIAEIGRALSDSGSTMKTASTTRDTRKMALCL